MATEQPRDATAPLREGDFHRIPGIGPGIEQRLHAAGIQTFDHLASLTAEEISATLNGLVGMTAERINQQDWPGKARLLAQSLHDDRLSLVSEEPGDRQHYASFMLELLQDEEHAVRRTRVVHVQSGVRDGWAGWDAGRLLSWIQSQAGPSNLATENSSAAQQESELPDGSLQQPLRRQPSLAVTVRAAEIVDSQKQQMGRFFYSHQPVELHIALDIGSDHLPAGTLLAYRVTVEARLIGTSDRIVLPEVTGEVAAQNEILLTIPLIDLPGGTYRLMTSATLYPAGDPHPENTAIQVFTEGGIVHVFTDEYEPARPAA